MSKNELSQFNPLHDKTKETNISFSIKDKEEICFIDEDLKGKPDAIIVAGELFGLKTMIPAIFAAYKQFPDSQVILTGGKNVRYGIKAPVETFMVAKSFNETTGMSLRTILGSNESEIIFNIVSSSDSEFAEIRQKLGVSGTIPVEQIKLVKGTNYHENLENAKSVMKADNINKSSILLIGPAHANRLYMTARASFPEADRDDKISFMPYVWEFAGMKFEKGLLDKKENGFIKQKIAGYAKSIINGEIKRIKTYSSVKEGEERAHVKMTVRVAQIYDKYETMAQNISFKQNGRTL